jgi:hypothetical protein
MHLIIRDKFGGVIECHNSDSSLEGWLSNNIPSYRKSARPPYSATLNGKPWPYANHDDPLTLEDVVELYIEPGEPATIVYWVIVILVAAYSYYQVSNLPKNQQNTTESGESIYNPNARSNRVKPSGVIREMAGSIKVFPDLLQATRRKYIDHEEFLYMFMCVTRGYASIRASNIYIAETPIINYSGDISVNIFEPGDTVTGASAHENWFQTKEVLGLKLTTATSTIFGLWTVSFSGDQMTSYLDGVATAFPFDVDSIFTLSGGLNAGQYKVSSISGASNETATVVSQRLDIGFLNSNTSSGAFVNNSAARVDAGGPRNVTNRVYLDSATSPQTSLTSSSPLEVVSWNAVVGGVNWEGPFAIIPENETCRYVEIDLNFPGGLVTLDSNGEQTNRSVEIAVQWRAVGEGSWTDVVDTAISPNGLTYTDNTYDERGYTIDVDLGSEIRPEFRFRRVTNDSQLTTVSDEVFIKRVKAKLETPTSYTDITTLAIVVRGTNALAGSAENKINIRGAVRKLPTLQEIQDAANGTPYDISAATTQTSGDFILSTANYIGRNFVTGDDITPVTAVNGAAFDFSSDGLRMLVFESGLLRLFTLNEPFEPNLGVTYNGYTSQGAGGLFPRDAMFAPDGAKIFTFRKQSDPSPSYQVTEVDFSTDYDPLTAAVGSTFVFGAEITDGQGFYIKNDGTQLWIGTGAGQLIEAYTMSTPFDPSTITRDMISLDVSTELGAEDLLSIWLDDYTGSPVTEPRKLWVMSDARTIYYYTLSGDISTASYVTSYDFTSENYLDFHVSQNHITLSLIEASIKGVSPEDREIQLSTFVLDSFVDNRESKSIVRFAANALYDTLGADVIDIVDWTAMSAMDTLLESRGDEFNAEFVDESTLWEALKIIFSPGYAEPAMKEGKLLPIRTTTGADYRHLYTPDFMTGDGLLIEHNFYEGQEPDGVDVEYLDVDSGEMEIVECRLSGDSGLRPKRIQSNGITNRTRAWRIGMRERRRLFYRPAQYTFSVEMDGLNSEYGDPIGIASDIFSSQTGTVTAATGNNLTLDFTPVFDTTTSPNPVYFAAFKKPTGEMSGLYTVVLGSPNNIITIIDSPGIDFTPVTDASPDSDGENTLVTLGTSDEWGVRAILKKITPSGDDRVDMLAEEYVADVYADDDNSPP